MCVRRCVVYESILNITWVAIYAKCANQDYELKCLVLTCVWKAVKHFIYTSNNEFTFTSNFALLAQGNSFWSQGSENHPWKILYQLIIFALLYTEICSVKLRFVFISGSFALKNSLIVHLVLQNFWTHWILAWNILLHDNQFRWKTLSIDPMRWCE